MGTIVRVLKTRYPNMKQVFFSSRIYGGYGGGLNPEPEAYESGFAVKWLIQAQIRQMESGGVVQDARAGDLNLNTGAVARVGGLPMGRRDHAPVGRPGVELERHRHRRCAPHRGRTGTVTRLRTVGTHV